MEELSNYELFRRLQSSVRTSRVAEADLIRHLGEVDRRRLYVGEACSSMFVYCQERLGFSEHETYLRIEAARAARRFPVLLEVLGNGKLHLSGLIRLSRHMNPGNAQELLERAAGKSHRQIVELCAELAPKPDVPTAVRKLPEPRPKPVAASTSTPVGELALQAPEIRLGAHQTRNPSSAPPPPRPSVTTPRAKARYKVEFTASVELVDKLERQKALLGPGNGDDLADVIEHASTENSSAAKRRALARPTNLANQEQGTTYL